MIVYQVLLPHVEMGCARQAMAKTVYPVLRIAAGNRVVNPQVGSVAATAMGKILFLAPIRLVPQMAFLALIFLQRLHVVETQHVKELKTA
jgi:hypothetical protein